ncbi:MAG TPA: hypothetical protein VFN27_07775, partial [Xanthobacteraceae bacterium]|nr:hypothetical protein [Xanthobacteraceae bacterium]
MTTYVFFRPDWRYTSENRSPNRRYGHGPANGLWQACIESYIHHYDYDGQYNDVMSDIFVNFLKVPSDNVPYAQYDGIKFIKGWFYKAKWYEVYNLVEFLFHRREAPRFIGRVSHFLETEKSGYRVVNKQLVPITDPVEIEAVAAASSLTSAFSGARHHLQSAISLFSKKPDPDYRNSIKEAISAVESVARVITGNPKATLGEALRKIDERMTIHPALREALSRLYGYTSDEGGIRHAMLEQSNIDEAEAKFMIV